jgi:hypothetical protein
MDLATLWLSLTSSDGKGAHIVTLVASVALDLVGKTQVQGSRRNMIRNGCTKVQYE